MNQQLSPTPSYTAQQQLQGILTKLADIERRLRRVNLAVASIASELAPVGQAETAPPSSDEEALVRAALVKPRSSTVVRTLAQANQRARQLAGLSPSGAASVADPKPTTVAG